MYRQWSRPSARAPLVLHLTQSVLRASWPQETQNVKRLLEEEKKKKKERRMHEITQQHVCVRELGHVHQQNCTCIICINRPLGQCRFLSNLLQPLAVLGLCEYQPGPASGPPKGKLSHQVSLLS